MYYTTINRPYLLFKIYCMSGNAIKSKHRDRNEIVKQTMIITIFH